MIVQKRDTHTPAEVLVAFALGHLEDSEAVAVAEHLEFCESCQEAVLAVPDDSMLSLLRPPAASTPVPAGATLSEFEDDVPPELRGHARYAVQRRLGEGGMGVVYKAEHRLMERTVALKVIRTQLTAKAAVVERFRREMRAVARLSHPNLVQAYDAEQTGAQHFLAMEFVEGESLSALIERDGPLPIETACNYARQAALGLAHAFAQDLVHRDVKPQNLMVTPLGQVKVLDFGLASFAAECGGAGGLTEFGQGMGTPDYMAPEQIRDARSVDTRADIYSLGCTLYFLLTGRPPFPEGNSAQKMAAHLEKKPTPAQQLRPELPAALVRAIERMMAKEPGQRYQTPADVVAALKPFCRPTAPNGSATDFDRPGATQPPHRRAAQPASSSRRKLVLGACLLVAFVLLTLFGGALVIRTKNGTIVLENLPADAEVLVDGDRVAVKLGDGGRLEIKAVAGTRKLEFRRDGLQFESEEVTLAAGDRKPIVVRRLPNPPEAGQKLQEPVPAVQVKPEDPAPDLSKVLPLIDDDFSDPDKSHFPTFSDKDVGNDFRFEKPGYVMRPPNAPAKWCKMSPLHYVVGDFACLVVGRATERDLGWGMRLSLSRQRSSPTVRLYRDGAVQVGTTIARDGGLSPIVEGLIPHPRFESADTLNKLLVIVRGGQSLEIYVNDVAIRGPIRLERPLDFAVMPEIMSWSGAAVFTRFTVWLLPPTAPPIQSEEAKRPPDLSKWDKRVDDDFSNPGKSLFAKERNVLIGFDNSFDKGGYVMANQFKCPPGHLVLDRYINSSPQIPITGDLACEVAGRILTERDNGWAVALFTPNSDDDVEVRLRRDGTVEVGNFQWEKRGQPNQITMLGPIRPEKLRSGSEPNTLLVILRDGQSLEIYVNGSAIGPPIQLKPLRAPIFQALVLWERTGHPEFRGRAEFRRFTVWEMLRANP